jgi:hypothetical protein
MLESVSVSPQCACILFSYRCDYPDKVSGLFTFASVRTEREILSHYFAFVPYRGKNMATEPFPSSGCCIVACYFGLHITSLFIINIIHSFIHSFIYGAGVEQSSLSLRPFIGRLYLPWMIVVMIVEKLVERISGIETGVFGENVPQCRSVHHRSEHDLTMDRTQSAVVGSLRLTACRLSYGTAS